MTPARFMELQKALFSAENRLKRLVIQLIGPMPEENTAEVDPHCTAAMFSGLMSTAKEVNIQIRRLEEALLDVMNEPQPGAEILKSSIGAWIGQR